MEAIAHRWPAEGLTRVPYWVYSDRDLYEEEQARIFRGPTWNFLCLEAELPKPNTLSHAPTLGAMPVVVTRDNDGKLTRSRTAARIAARCLCINERGEARDIVCVYHNWSYDLAGNLTGVAFRKGIGGKGGMPARCAARRARAAQAAGRDAVAAWCSARCRPTRRRSKHYLGPEIVKGIRRVMRAPVQLLGGYSQMLPSNWKLYMENVKDTYHASLLHTFFTTFRLNRLSQKGGLVISETGGNHISYSLAADTGGKEYEQAGMRAAQEGFGLEAPRGAASRSTSTATASGCRSSRCSRPSCCSRPATASRCAGWCRRASRRPSWSGPCFGFTDDDEAMTERRLQQANLIGPAGYISMEDGAAPGFVQRGVDTAPDVLSVVEMGGREHRVRRHPRHRGVGARLLEGLPRADGL